jgi:hypothetical protein
VAAPKASKKRAPARKPRDRIKSREEVLNSPMTFEWDDQEWTFVPADATSLEFIEALEDDHMVSALRLLLGREQASRLIKGRKVSDLDGFMEAMSEAVGSGNL